MMKYYELSVIYKVLLQTILIVVLVIQINAVISLTFNVKKHFIAFIQMVAIILNVTMLSIILGEHQIAFRGLGNAFIIKSITGMPVAALLVFLLLVTVLFNFSVEYLNRLQKNMITDSSIKESTDDLPMGLCFGKKDGTPLLVNRKMYMLSIMIMGAALQNARQFWEMVATGNLPEGIVRVKDGKEPVLLLQNGSVWTFSKEHIKIGREKVVQVMAIDTTDLYNLRFELEDKNKSLKEMHVRLQDYSENVTNLVREEEILATKIKIHADMGNALLATRYYLNNQKDEIQAEALIKTWNNNVSLLYNEANQEIKEDIFQHLNEAAKAVGVTIEVDGKIPENTKVERLIVAAARECLTNTVRHGDGDRVMIRIQENQMFYHLEYTNNGIAPEESIKEGGGLMGLRKRVEDIGGNMQIISNSQFVLLINLPRERG